MNRFKSNNLKQVISEILVAVGATRDNANRVAESLVEASLRGHDSHGVQQLFSYVDRIPTAEDDVDPTKRAEQESDLNQIDPAETPTVKDLGEYTSAVRGKHCFGRVVGEQAVNVLCKKTEATGIGLVSMHDVNHLGRIGEWAEDVAGRGFLFMAFVKGEGKLVAPAGSADRKLSTNPIAFGVPTFSALKFPIVLDMATGMVAGGKTRAKQLEDEPLPAAWTVTQTGEPVLDAEAFRDGKGALLPVGGQDAGYKGFGLSVITELFASIIGNGVIAGERDYVSMNNTASFFAVDPVTFSSVEGIERRIRTLVDHLRDAEYPDPVSPGIAAHGNDGLIPGEAEFLTETERRTEGIPLPDRTIDQLKDLSRRYDVDCSFVEDCSE